MSQEFQTSWKRQGGLASIRCSSALRTLILDNLAAAKKRQNKITEYRKMLLAWKEQGIMTIAGYILGFPADTPETIRRDIAIIKEELPVDLLEFFCLTPLPGSEDHQSLWKNGTAIDPDLNKYDVEHVCTSHSRMSDTDWQDIYHEAWLLYYTPEHMKTLLRRARATGVPWAISRSICSRFRRRIASNMSTRCRGGSSASSIHPNAGPDYCVRALGCSGCASAVKRL